MSFQANFLVLLRGFEVRSAHICAVYLLAVDGMARDLAKSCHSPWQRSLLTWLHRLLFNILAYSNSFLNQIKVPPSPAPNIYYYSFCNTYQRKRKQPCQDMIRGRCAVLRT